MVISLILGGMLNGPDLQDTPQDFEGTQYLNTTARADYFTARSRLHTAEAISKLLGGGNGRGLDLEMGHLGRLRLYELQDQLKVTRLREPFGILFDARYVERDLSIAIMNIRPDAPVALAYLDMNGLKAFNEEGDHATGDAAIKAFFRAIDKAASGAGDAYRKGGDEVVVVMPGLSLKEAQKHMNAILVSLAKETVSVNGEHRRLSSSCGLISISKNTAEAEGEIHRADLVQKKAKDASKPSGQERCSALFVQDEAGKTEELLVP